MGSIRDKFRKGSTVFSCEIYPPKKEDELLNINSRLDRFRNIRPDFLSVTYGAGGSNAGKAVEIASYIQNSCGIEALSHITSVGFNKERLKSGMTDFRAQGIENVLALRGDRPKFMTDEEYDSREFLHASDMVSYLHDNYTNITIAGACYPEKHFEAASYEDDLKNLKIKADAGCDFLISQLFFDNECFFRLTDSMAAMNIDIPVSAGIMPITSAKQLGTTVTLSGTSIPKALSDMIAKYGDSPEDMKKAGISFAIGQVEDLLSHGVRGIHLYIMNKPDLAETIFTAVR